MTPTLSDRLSTSDNALNAVRLGLATAVIFGHAFPLGGFEPLRFGPFQHAGFHGQAVDGFFAISGYLILGSAMRVRTRAYLWRRFLRIYPGYVVALVATAFVFASVGAAIEPGSRWQTHSALRYVVGALDLKPSQEGVVYTLHTTPWRNTWNGSLWTLFYEGAAYVGIAVLAVLPIFRRHTKTGTLVLAGAGTMIYTLVPAHIYAALPGPLSDIAGNGARLWTYFALGMVAFAFRDVLRVHTTTVAGAWLTFFMTNALALSGPAVTALEMFALTWAALGTGAVFRGRLTQETDISYGVYVYAFPVQQVLVLLGVAEYGWFVTAASCLLFTVPLAFASWHWIEHPALALKRLVSTRPASREPATSA